MGLFNKGLFWLFMLVITRGLLGICYGQSIETVYETKLKVKGKKCKLSVMIMPKDTAFFYSSERNDEMYKKGHNYYSTAFEVEEGDTLLIRAYHGKRQIKFKEKLLIEGGEIRRYAQLNRERNAFIYVVPPLIYENEERVHYAIFAVYRGYYYDLLDFVQGEIKEAPWLYKRDFKIFSQLPFYAAIRFRVRKSVH